MLEMIPADRSQREYYQGNALGSRYDSRSRIILYPWVNDERSLPQRDGKSDPYEMIRRMLASDNPPNEWGRWLDVPKSCQVKFCRPWRTV